MPSLDSFSLLNTPRTPVAPPVAGPVPDAMAAAARDFEAMFLTEMIRPMLETVAVDDVFGGGKGEDVFRGLLADEYGKNMARAGGIGLASHIQAALIAAQEGGQHAK
jgi:peptidoglycan hydrolase FlgJ